MLSDSTTTHVSSRWNLLETARFVLTLRNYLHPRTSHRPPLPCAAGVTMLVLSGVVCLEGCVAQCCSIEENENGRVESDY